MTKDERKKAKADRKERKRLNRLGGDAAVQGDDYLANEQGQDYDAGRAAGTTIDLPPDDSRLGTQPAGDDENLDDLAHMHKRRAQRRFDDDADDAELEDVRATKRQRVIDE